LPRVLRVDGYAMDMIPEGHMVLLINKDQPGVIGMVGSSFGDASVNIADMVISRYLGGEAATAMMMIKTDSQPPEALLTKLRQQPNIIRAKAVELPGRSS
jgi:D-3-phosphoglycerate dehydrogenase